MNDLNLQNGPNQIKSNQNIKEVKFANESEEAADNGQQEDQSNHHVIQPTAASEIQYNTGMSVPEQKGSVGSNSKL
jgi:hypothetical protein